MSTSVGRDAEAAAARFLRRHGFTIACQNWRTRWCEIDILAIKNNIVYFVEVKYRAKDTWGGGLDYVTPQKLSQMHFAAEFWVSKHRFDGDWRISALELFGNPPQVSEWLEDLS